MNKFKLGIQLYTVRNELEKDFLGTLHFLAAQGVEGVEFACNYGGLEPDKLAISLHALELETYGLYEAVDSIADINSKVYDYTEALDCKYLTCGFQENVLKDDFELCLDKLKKASQTAKSKNLNLCYHAHAYEFDKYDLRSYLEIILDETDLLFEADTAWIHAGGENVKTYLEKYKDKIPLVHIKDITEDIDYTELGNGVVNFNEVIDFAYNSQVEWLAYEQDFSKIGELESTKISFKFIKNLLTQKRRKLSRNQ
jgi:sugar phosphate isomerase/epimerase